MKFECTFPGTNFGSNVHLVSQETLFSLLLIFHHLSLNPSNQHPLHSSDPRVIWLYLRDLIIQSDYQIASGLYTFRYLLSLRDPPVPHFPAPPREGENHSPPPTQISSPSDTPTETLEDFEDVKESYRTSGDYGSYRTKIHRPTLAPISPLSAGSSPLDPYFIGQQAPPSFEEKKKSSLGGCENVLEPQFDLTAMILCSEGKTRCPLWIPCSSERKEKKDKKKKSKLTKSQAFMPDLRETI